MSTKTESVRSRVFQAILRGDYGPGDRIPAEREMARLAGTSRVTVRRAYAELERSGILERRQGSGARIRTAGSGNPRTTNAVAVLASLRDAFAVEFVEAMDRVLAEQEAFLALRLTEQDAELERRAAMDMAEWGVRGMVVWASGGGYDRDLFARLRILGTNLVFFDRMIPGGFADYVGLDNRHAVRTLMEHACRRGRHRFLFVNHNGLGADSDHEREAAFVRYCREHRLRSRVVPVSWGGDAAAELRSQAADWLRESTGLAVVGVNDSIAVQVRSAYPSLATYGVDGLPAAVQKGVVSVRQPMERMARAAVRLLVEQEKLGERWKPRKRLFAGELVEA
jgi:DNA-binding LacI/PurR family transcriptional regulator